MRMRGFYDIFNFQTFSSSPEVLSLMLELMLTRPITTLSSAWSGKDLGFSLKPPLSPPLPGYLEVRLSSQDCARKPKLSRGRGWVGMKYPLPIGIDSQDIPNWKYFKLSRKPCQFQAGRKRRWTAQLSKNKTVTSSSAVYREIKVNWLSSSFRPVVVLNISDQPDCKCLSGEFFLKVSRGSWESESRVY